MKSRSDNREEQLKSDVTMLASMIGERNIYLYSNLFLAANFIDNSFREAGYIPHRQTYRARGRDFVNLEVQITGTDEPYKNTVVGAHYDSAKGSPGADDNASGVAALLALSRELRNERLARTVRFVAFTNEERPFLRKRTMGSRVYAARCRREREEIEAMISLESLGCFSDVAGSQRLSLFGALLPRKGNFAAFVSDRNSRDLLYRADSAFRRYSNVPTRLFALPRNMPGARSSDNWSFWKAGFPALMITDTASLRNPAYHRPDDLPELLNYAVLDRVVEGLLGVVRSLASGRLGEYRRAA